MILFFVFLFVTRVAKTLKSPLLNTSHFYLGLESWRRTSVLNMFSFARTVVDFIQSATGLKVKPSHLRGVRSRNEGNSTVVHSTPRKCLSCPFVSSSSSESDHSHL